MSTKERILYESLKMFSIKGYEATSMRDLATVVGIQQSSIYKHYANKKAILDAIVDRVMSEIDEVFKQLKVPMVNEEIEISQYEQMSACDIASMCTEMFLVQMSNETIRQFRQFLTIEQYKDQALRNLFQEMFINKQLGYIEKVLSYLIKKGIFRQGDPKELALTFYSPFFMLQYKYGSAIDELESVLQFHVIAFIEQNMKEE